MSKILFYLKKHWFIFFAIAIYVFFAAFYMGPGLTKCTDSIYGFGDSTAGPIWKNSLKPDQPPFGGFENSTNYPYGETLYSPVGYAASVQTIAMDAGSQVVGPVCAYNLYNLLGYLTTALIMFAFVFYMSRRPWVSLLAGYAVAFTPYVQSKIGGHPSYGYASLLIAALWLTVHLLVYRKRLHAMLLGGVLGVCAYFDPYFILLSITVVVPTASVWLLTTVAKYKRKRLEMIGKLLRGLVRPVLIALGVFLLLVAPLIAIRVKDAALIESTVGNVRGNVVDAAMLCSNKPLDYLLPDPTNIYLVNVFRDGYAQKNIQHRNWCGYGESRVSLSLTALTVITLGGGIYLWKRQRKHQIPSSNISAYRHQLMIYVLVAVGLSALLVGLPPYINGVITPSGIVLKTTEMWRIFAREYLVVNVAVVVLFSLALSWIMSLNLLRRKRWLAAAIFILVALGINAEYQINNPFSPITFSYSRDIPSVYGEVKNNKNITAIAEYPLDRVGVEHDSAVYYLTMQGSHGKKILNSATSNKSTEKLHIALKDLTDPQTLPVLRYLGVYYLVVHGERLIDIKARLGNEIEVLKHDIPSVYALTMVRADEDNDVVLLHVKEGPKLSSVLTIERGLVVNLPLIQSPLDTEYETIQDAQLRLNTLGGGEYSGIICFDAKMSAGGDISKLSIKDSRESVIYQTVLTDVYQRIELPAGTNDIITLHNERGYNVRINNLNVGCRE